MDKRDTLRALFVEDNPDDAELIALALEHAGFDTVWRRVERESEFIESLDDSVQIVLCDTLNLYNLHAACQAHDDADALDL